MSFGGNFNTGFAQSPFTGSAQLHAGQQSIFGGGTPTAGLGETPFGQGMPGAAGNAYLRRVPVAHRYRMSTAGTVDPASGQTMFTELGPTEDCPFVFPAADPRRGLSPWFVMDCQPSPLLTPATTRMRLPASGPVRKEHKVEYNRRIPGTLILEGPPDRHGLRPRVWILSKEAAQSRQWLEDNLIGVVLPCTDYPLVKPNQRHRDVKYLGVCDVNSYVLHDLHPQILLEQLYEFDDHVEDAAASGLGAAIACVQAANRSAIIAVLYLAMKTGADIPDAASYLNQLRPITDISIGLWRNRWGEVELVNPTASGQFRQGTHSESRCWRLSCQILPLSSRRLGGVGILA